MVAEPTYRSDTRPDFAPFEESCGTITGFAYAGDLATELAAGRDRRRRGPRPARRHARDPRARGDDRPPPLRRLRPAARLRLPRPHPRLDRPGGRPAVGRVLRAAARRQRHELPPRPRRRDRQGLRGDPPHDRRASSGRACRDPPAETHDELLEAALEEHVYRVIAELFGKEEGYCRGRGGGMHIGDFSTGNLGANAIVGGSVPIATGAAMAIRYEQRDRVVCCFAGDGAYANGVVLESLNWAAQDQWTNHLAGDHAYGLPIIYFIQNNHYGMTHRTDDEVMGVRHLARRAAGFAEDNMHAEVVNGMDVLAVRDAVRRAAALCRAGEGPVLIEASAPTATTATPCPTRATSTGPARRRPPGAPSTRSSASRRQLVEAGVADEAGRRRRRGGRPRAQRPGRPSAPSRRDRPGPGRRAALPVHRHGGRRGPGRPRASFTTYAEPPVAKRDAAGAISYKDALREALVEEMTRDARVIHYGEDVADYGGAFKLTKGLLETFGRERVFNTPISEACICGTAVGAAIVGPAAGRRADVHGLRADGVRPDRQPGRQVALHERRPGRGAARDPRLGRRRQGLRRPALADPREHLHPHPRASTSSTRRPPADAKGLLKSAIRTNNPVLFVESQGLYPTKGVVPEDEYLVPIGQARVAREGTDVTIVAWGPAVLDALAAAETLAAEHGVAAEVIDLRSLVPLDMETVLASVRKTGRCVVASQAVLVGQLRQRDRRPDPARGVRLPRRARRAGSAPRTASRPRPRASSRPSCPTPATSSAPSWPSSDAAEPDDPRTSDRWSTRSSCRSPAR